MLPVFKNLFEALHMNNVNFCNWKGSHSADKHLNGEGDLDLFVPIDFKKQFEQIAKDNGFRNVVSYQSSHEHIEHYYGLDQESCIFVHIHVYFKIITGEHASKNYNLPIEGFILKNIDRSYPLPKINSVGQHAIFLIRHFLKIGSIYGYFQYWREREKYENEWDSFDHNFSFENISELGLTINELKEMYRTYEKKSFLYNLLSSVKLKKILKRYRRRTYIRHQIFKIQDVIIRILNKFFIKKQKILNPGLVVAICGLDGSGKSSVVSALRLQFSKYFCTKIIHLGRPSSNPYTLFFNLFISIFSFFKKFKFFMKKTKHQKSSSKNISLIFAIRSVLLAYDRKTQSKKAYNLSKKGYIVICDRYPGLTNGKMDSPRIPTNESRGFLYQFCYRKEQNLYRSIKLAKFIFHLSVPLEVAINRNRLRVKFGKETEEELAERFLVNSDAKFLGENYRKIDASPPFQTVLNQIMRELWLSGDWN